VHDFFQETDEGQIRVMMQPFMQHITQLLCTGNDITASALIPADSVWYAGHFPGNPILPGIAILALVEEAILASELREKRQVVMMGISRVRFRLPVKPDDLMTLKIAKERKKTGFTYEFSVSLAEELACTGFLKARIVAE
jgi:3-hydroxyacyl-[acyl-carrier-protein] dehydratase